ncbi:hypothetical protein AAE478_004994 [Parahypoxylon ruwenzoriense]
MRRCKGIVKLLLERGANIENRDNCCITPLLQAILENWAASGAGSDDFLRHTVRMLLENGAVVKYRSDEDRTRISYVIELEDGRSVMISALRRENRVRECGDGEIGSGRMIS